MHDLLNEEENRHAHVLVLLNVALNITEINIANAEEEENQHQRLVEEMKIAVYFHLIPQENKHINCIDLYDDKNTKEDIEKVRKIIFKYIKDFD